MSDHYQIETAPNLYNAIRQLRFVHFSFALPFAFARVSRLVFSSSNSMQTTENPLMAWIEDHFMTAI